MFRTYKIEGIVIKRINFGESDKLVTVFTKNQGKIVLLAKGIRKINSRKSPHLELFNHISAFVAKGKSWDYITEARAIQVFQGVSTHLEKMAYVYRISEEVDFLCPEKEINNEIYILLLQTLKQIDVSGETKINAILIYFTHSLLWFLGYLPRGKIMESSQLDIYLMEIMERNLKSNVLLTKLDC